MTTVPASHVSTLQVQSRVGREPFKRVQGANRLFTEVTMRTVIDASPRNSGDSMSVAISTVIYTMLNTLAGGLQ